MVFSPLFFRSYLEVYCPAKKKRGREEYQSIRLDFVHNRRYFLGTLKGPLSCFKCQKAKYSV